MEKYFDWCKDGSSIEFAPVVYWNEFRSNRLFFSTMCICYRCTHISILDLSNENPLSFTCRINQVIEMYHKFSLNCVLLLYNFKYCKKICLIGALSVTHDSLWKMKNFRTKFKQKSTIKNWMQINYLCKVIPRLWKYPLLVQNSCHFIIECYWKSYLRRLE